MNKILLLIATAVITALPVKAQTIDLTEDQKEELANRIVDKLEDFQYFLQTMADNRNSMTVRKNAMESNVNLFIGRCEPYEVFEDWYGSGVQHPAVKMQTSSVRGGNKTPQPMKRYLSRILGGMGYSNIQIEQSDAIRVDNIKKVGDGKYMAVAHIFQTFIGYGNNEGQIRYADNTEKKVIVHINIVDLPSEDGGNNDVLYDVKLGDMSVVSTSKIR